MLMNDVLGEAGQSEAGAGEDGFDLVGGREAAHTVKNVRGLFFGQHSQISRRDAARRVFPLHRIVAAPQKRGNRRLYAYTEPTRIFRNRAALAPSPIPTTHCRPPLP